MDFSVTVNRARACDVIFADPPYFDGTGGGYTSYVSGGWSITKQEYLADCLAAARDRGVKIIATDGGSDRTREVYESRGFEKFSVAAQHSISARARGRKRTREWLMVSDLGIVS